MPRMINLDELGWLIHRNAKDKGFWEFKIEEDRVNQVLAKMMLIDTEVSELADAYVKRRGTTEIENEMADIAIRLLDLYQALKVYGLVERDFSTALQDKVKYNSTRPPKHNRLM